MSDSNKPLKFKEIEIILHNIHRSQLKIILNQYQIKKEIIAKTTLYNLEDIIKLKCIMEEKYQFNKNNRLVKSQLLELGLNPQAILKFDKVKAEPIERIYEFKGAHVFYSKDEVFQKLHEIEEKNRLLGIEKIQEILGASHFNQVNYIIKHFKIEGKKIGKLRGLKYEPLEIEKIKKWMDERYQYNSENYLSYAEVLAIGCNQNDFSYLTAIKTLPMDCIGKFKGVVTFYKKEEVIARLTSRNLDYETYSTSEVIKLLNAPLDYRYLQKIGVNSVSIPGTHENHWSKKEIDDLLKLRNQLYTYYSNNFLTVKEFESLFSIPMSMIKRYANKLNIQVEYHKIPKEIKFNKFSFIRNLIAKKDVVTLMNSVINHLKISPNEKKVLTSTLYKFTKHIKDSDDKGDSLVKKFVSNTRNQSMTDFIDYVEIIESENFEEMLEEYADLLEDVEIKKLVISEHDIIKKYDIGKATFLDIRNKNKEKIHFITYKNLNYYALNDIEGLFINLINLQHELLSDCLTTTQVQELGISRFLIANYKSNKVISSNLSRLEFITKSRKMKSLISIKKRLMILQFQEHC